jgi:EpsI family protein
VDKRAPNYIAVIIMLLAAATITYVVRCRPAMAISGADLKYLPKQMGEWIQAGPDRQQSKTVLDAWYVNADNFLTRTYTNPDGAVVDLMSVYKGSDRRGWHLSEMCFNGTGFNVTRSYTAIPFAGKSAQAVKLVALNKNTGHKIIALYVFVNGKHVEASFAKQQIAMALARLRPSKYGWAFVRVTGDVISSEQETIDQLRKFLAAASGPLGDALTSSRTD